MTIFTPLESPAVYGGDDIDKISSPCRKDGVNAPSFLTGFAIYSRLWVLKLIKIYQKIFSFDHGFFRVFFPYGFCRFRPTCSEYALEAIEKYGIIRGGFKALLRIIRCNPLSKSKFDPLI